jgi:hypothetical protein
MNKPRAIALVLSLSIASAWAGNATVSAFVQFKGTSTLHDFEGGAVTQPFPATFTDDTATGSMRVSTEVALKVLDMTTEHGKRDKNMYKMLDEQNHKLIKGSLENAVIPQKGTGTVTLRLMICGVEQEVTATISEVERTDEQINCRMAFPVSLAAFNLKAPSVMGLIKVGDTVEVECAIQGTLE